MRSALLLLICVSLTYSFSAHAEEPSAKPPGENPMSSKKFDPKTFKRPNNNDLKKLLSPKDFAVSCNNATEPPFQNAYWNNHADGIYVDKISGEPLFSSLDQFDSGTGWPSFTKPLTPANVLNKEDKSFGTVRTEVRSKHGDSHLGHVFNDGPGPTGLRFCINSASLKFIPAADLEKEGYEEFKPLFKKEH